MVTSARALCGPVAVALSGGLDSAMALALLQEAGHKVIGVTMLLWPATPDDDGLADDIRSAREICARYGAPHRILDLRQTFYEEIVDPYVRAYAQALTPNPCIRCNERIKFGAMLSQVRALGYQWLATGHYARVTHTAGLYRLLRGADTAKDQSYFLYTLSQEQLAHVLFPLGGYCKTEIRRMARERGLRVAERAESQDVCFMRGESQAGLLARLAPDALKPGPIVDRSGRRLGTHRGLALYTVGQRSGLGVAADRPLYVLSLDAQSNALIVGYGEDLARQAVIAEEMCYVSGIPVPSETRLQAQIRYRARPASAIVTPLPGRRARIVFDEPVRGVAPGQSVVCFEGDDVIGGGRIAGAEPATQEDLRP